MAASPQEAEAHERVRQLEQQQKAVAIERTQVDKTLDAARADVARLGAELEFVLNPDNFLPVVDLSSQEASDRYLTGLNLPALERVPARRAEDTRYARYLEFFTEVDESGALRLKRAVLEAPRASSAAYSALAGSMMPGMRLSSFLRSLLNGNLDGIKAALRAGEGLEEAVRQKVAASFHDFVESCRSVVESASARPPELSRGRRRRRFEGTHVSRATADEAAARNGHLVSLQEVPEHRDNILQAAMVQACSLMSDHGEKCRDVGERLAVAQARFAAARRALLPLVERAVGTAQQLDVARAQRDALLRKRRRCEAEQTTGDPRPSAAAIPQTRTPVSSFDPEARRLKLRGDMVGHGEAIGRAQEAIAQVDDQIRAVSAGLRGHEAALEAAAAAYARDAAGARRQHGEYREELTGLRRQLDDLNARILRARDELGNHPARRAMVSDHAWAQAVERHVEPDDTALRDRARITGHAGVYASPAGLGLAVADVHAHLSQQPDFHALLNAGTADEFDRAATHVPGGVIDRVHDHGRPVGRGFSNHPDQTARPAGLTRSCYSLQFVQGRVLISHIYPQVPYRQLRVAP